MKFFNRCVQTVGCFIRFYAKDAEPSQDRQDEVLVISSPFFVLTVIELCFGTYCYTKQLT